MGCYRQASGIAPAICAGQITLSYKSWVSAWTQVQEGALSSLERKVSVSK